VATRRDLDDPGTIDAVARAAGSVTRLELLAALTEADSLATGSSAWGPWKADLVAELVARAEHVLRGGAASDVAVDELTPEQQALLAAGPRRVDVDGGVLTIVDRDRPGLFSHVAAVLTAHGVDVVAAAVHSDEHGTALEQFFVERALDGEIAWPAVIADLNAMLDGEFDPRASVEARARTYARRDALHAGSVRHAVTFDNEMSAAATVVDVHAEDGVGVLYRITDVLARHGLDIRSAKVQTMGAQVVDAFYVTDAEGQKVTDAERLRAIRDDVLAAVASPA
jgi:[protein-PII] uridylyltransferase